jgi:hypothetical protein
VTSSERLAELAVELQNGKVVEARLRANGEHLDGLCDYGSNLIYIDPRPAIVATLLHELIHRRWRAWGEKRVLQEERRLLAHMTPEDVSRWYRMYERAKRTRLSVKRVEDSD